MVFTPRVKLDWKRIATIATIGILIGLGVAIWSAGNESIPQPNSGQTMSNGTAEGRRAQFASWEFTYDKATTLPDGVTQEISGIRDGVFYKNGKPFIHMRAQTAVFDTLTHDFTLSGTIHFDIDDKGKTRTFETDSATWSDQSQTLRIPGDAYVGSEGGARLLVHNVTIDLRNATYKVGKIEGGATP
jgi:hypothetical protein